LRPDRQTPSNYQPLVRQIDQFAAEGLRADWRCQLLSFMPYDLASGQTYVFWWK
jgi:hypothetical protein